MRSVSFHTRITGPVVGAGVVVVGLGVVCIVVTLPILVMVSFRNIFVRSPNAAASRVAASAWDHSSGLETGTRETGDSIVK